MTSGGNSNRRSIQRRNERQTVKAVSPPGASVGFQSIESSAGENARLRRFARGTFDRDDSRLFDSVPGTIPAPHTCSKHRFN